MQCSPSNIRFLDHHNTCFSKTQLINIAKVLEIKSPKSKSKQQLWSMINQAMLPYCRPNDEHCWLKQIGDEDSNSHVPLKPSEWKENPYTWLSNIDILKVLVRYEKKYRSFKFLGVFPIDFAENYGMSQCISQEICNLNLSKFNKKYTQFACVFNLDKHYQSGSHWVAVYFNLNKKHPNYGFYFFDSVSTKIPREIHRFGLSIKRQVNDPDFNIHQNIVQKQFKSTECGIFSIHFVIKCLEKMKFHDILRVPYNDDDIHKLRNVFYRDD